MSVTILEALENAEFNLDNVQALGPMALKLAREQLRNARVLLEKGYSPDAEVEPLLERYGDADSVPGVEEL